MAEPYDEEDVSIIIRSFYKKLIEDDLLGPFFAQNIGDWDGHLLNVINFWQCELCGAKTYTGTPMPKHVALHGLTRAMFDRWLVLFEQTADSAENRIVGKRAIKRARQLKIALWDGYTSVHGGS